MKIEDIINLEVPLIRDGVLSSEYGANVHFLDGSIYPITATIKDLRSASNLLRDREAGLDHIAYYDITFGNSGRSHGILANFERENTGRNLMTFLIIPKGYKNFRNDLEKNGSIVVERDVSKFISEKEIEKIIGNELKKRNINWPEVNILPISNGVSEGQGYRKLGEEILRQNSGVEKIFVPYGSGETGIGIYNFFKEKFDNGEIQRMPTIVLTQTNDKKRIRGKNLTEDKTKTRFVTFENRINKLAENGKVEILEVSENERDIEYKFLKEHGVKIEKTSALAFTGARKYGLNRNDNVVIINSGEGRSYKKKLSHQLYESDLSRIAASVLLGTSLLFGYIQYHETRIQQKMEHKFYSMMVKNYGISAIRSPPIGDILVEERQAFMNGIIKDPHYRSKEHLQTIVERGKNFRQSFKHTML